ncbi:MAG: DNA alkylation repair protein, partial [Yaniella sp.]|nr:DNA alkylation repair protein [Yaniella sp.]
AARVPKVHDWLVSYILKKNPEAENRRIQWMTDPDEVVASASWALTSHAVAKNASHLKLDQLLDTIEIKMQHAPAQLQWAMNECLANIGIHHPEQRNRALDIGERLGVLKDYPTPPNCTSPFAPAWINEMVSRQ